MTPISKARPATPEPDSDAPDDLEATSVDRSAAAAGTGSEAVQPSRLRPLLLGALVALLLLGGVGTLMYTLFDDDASPAKQVQGAGPVEVDLRAPSRRPAPSAIAKEPTEAGATAFALFYFDAVNYSLANLDTDLLASHTNAGCQQCTGYLIGIQRWKEQGARLEGGLTVPTDMAIGAFSATEPVQLAATFLTTPATVTQRDGAAADYPGGRTRGGLTLLHANGQWQVTDLVLDVSQAGPRP